MEYGTMYFLRNTVRKSIMEYLENFMCILEISLRNGSHMR